MKTIHRILISMMFLAACAYGQPELTNTEATNIDDEAERQAWKAQLHLLGEIKSANFTAANNTAYVADATLTVTDPAGEEGKGFSVFVNAGTATVGGTAYATAGTIIRRFYEGGAWLSRASTPDNDVSITGGSITGITDLAIADGGTGASDEAGMKANFNLEDADIVSAALAGATDDGAANASTLLKSDAFGNQRLNQLNLQTSLEVETGGQVNFADGGSWNGGDLYTSNSIELGHASDTTLARGAAGRLTVEGVNVPTISSTDTLTNKTLTSPTINGAALSGTLSGSPTFSGNVTMSGDLTVDTSTLYVDSANNRVAIGSASTVSGEPLRMTGNASSIFCVLKNTAASANARYYAWNATKAWGFGVEGGTDDMIVRDESLGYIPVRITAAGNIQAGTGATLSFASNSGTWNGATIAGAQTMSGQLELTGQAATNSTSAMTRGLVDELLWKRGSRSWQVVNAPAFSNSGTSSIGNTNGPDWWACVASGSDNSGYGKSVIASGINNTPANSGTGIIFSRDIGVSINATIYTGGTDANRVRFIVGTNNQASAPAATSADPISDHGFGVEFRGDGTNTEWRVFAHNGTTFTASAWTDLYVGDFLQPQNIALHNDGSGTITAYRANQGSHTFTSISTTGGSTGLGTAAKSYVGIEAINSASGTNNASIIMQAAHIYTE